MIIQRKASILLIGIILCYALFLQPWAVFSFTIDDMYISLRYAKHWANGDGLLWNIHEPAVEGYSNFSFVVLAALGLKLGINPVMLLKLIGWVGLGFSTLATYCLSRFWFSPVLAIIPCFGLLFYRGEIIWSISGLETTLYQALIAFSLLCLLKAVGYKSYPLDRGAIKSNAFVWSGFLFALASLTRPEAPCLMLLFFAIAWFDRPKTTKTIFLKSCSLGILIFCVIYTPYFLWRCVYYERLLPNPVYCKGITDSFFSVVDKNYLLLAWPFFILALSSFRRASDKRPYYFLLPSLLYLILLMRADPVVTFDNRLFLPVFILLLPVAFFGLKQWVSYWTSEEHDLHHIIFLIAAFLVLFFFIPMRTLEGYRQFSLAPQSGERIRQQAINWLSKEGFPGSKVVLADSGMIPYFSSLNFIDSYCLNNKEMTRQLDSQLYHRFCDQILKQKPEVIILTFSDEDGKRVYTPADECLNAALKKNNTYHLRVIFKTMNKYSYGYEIYTIWH